MEDTVSLRCFSAACMKVLQESILSGSEVYGLVRHILQNKRPGKTKQSNSRSTCKSRAAGATVPPRAWFRIDMRKLQESDIPTVRLYPLGDAAVVVHFGDVIGEETHRQVRAFAAYLAKHPFEGLVEYVPAFTTVTVYYDPWIISQKGNLNPYTKVTGFLQRMLPYAVGAGKEQVPRRVEIPVLYGGESGPDLPYVAEFRGLSPEEVIALHSGQDYLVYMIGFAPGFPYLGGLNPRLATPRRESPRPEVPAGSVGIGGSQTGIYPLPTPGGWPLIGRTPLPLVNPDCTSPCLLQAGDHVRFVPITEEEYHVRKEQCHES